MSIYDYSIAGDWADVVHALVLTENAGLEPIVINIVGDGGQAMGVLQQHPAFFQEYYGRAGLFPASVSDTWSQAQIKAAAAFLETWKGVGIDLLIQGYNQGIDGVMKGNVRAPEYLGRFTMMMNKIHGKYPDGVAH